MRRASVLMVIAFTACSHEQSKPPASAAVEVAPVREVATGGGIRYSATVEPDAQVAVAFRVGGYVEEVAVEESDRVAKGTMLARLRESDYVNRVGQAEAQKQQAEAALAQARTDLERARTLFAANALTKPELDAAIARFETTQAQVSGGRAATGEASLALHDTTIVAPIRGVILRRHIERGDLAAPGSPAFIIGKTDTVKVIFGVPDVRIASLRIGQTIDVRTESMPDRIFSGRIARIAPAADPRSRNFDIELHIDNHRNELKPGTVVSLEIAPGQSQMLAVPLAAVVRPPKSAAGYAVYVVNNDIAQARVVSLGEPMGNLVFVRGGLRPGERVVVSGPALLVDGQPVRVVGGAAYAQE